MTSKNDYFPDGKFPLWNTDVTLANTLGMIERAKERGDCTACLRNDDTELRTHTAISKAAEKYDTAILTDCSTTVDEMIHNIALHAASTRMKLTTTDVEYV